MEVARGSCFLDTLGNCRLECPVAAVGKSPVTQQSLLSLKREQGRCP